MFVLQELHVEKQKTGRVEAMLREQRAALEKELGSFQAKAQELQAMQMKVSLSPCSFSFKFQSHIQTLEYRN